MNETQLKSKLTELQTEMIKLRAQISTHTTLENPGRVKAVRKTIARIYTRLTEKKKEDKKETEKPKEVKKEEKPKSQSQLVKKTKEATKANK